MSIRAYVATVDAVLGGPRRARQELLTELADGLVDAAEAHRANGLPRAAAEQRAVDEAGEPGQLAARYREVMAAAQGRRTAALFAVSTVASVLAWDAVWQFAGTAGGEVPPLALLCYRIIDWSGAIAALVAIGCLGLLVLGARRGWRPYRIVAAQAWIGGLSVLLTLTCSMLGNSLSRGRVAGVFVDTPVVAVLGVLSLAVMSCQLTSAWRSFRAVRAGTTGYSGLQAYR